MGSISVLQLEPLCPKLESYSHCRTLQAGRSVPRDLRVVFGLSAALQGARAPPSSDISPAECVLQVLNSQLSARLARA